MKKIYFLLFTLTTCFSFGQNMAVNGGFETWNTGVLDTWTSETGTTITQEMTTVAEGAFAANFEVITGDQAATDFRQSINVDAGVVYNISVQIYQEDNGSRARIYADGYQNYSDPLLVGEWQTITFEYTAGATGSVEFGLRFYDTTDFNGTSSTIIVDDFIVEAQSSPSIAVLSPTDGTTIPSGDIDIELSVQNFIVDELPGNGGTGDGHIHYTVDGGGIVMKYNTDPISLIGLADGVHTVELELVDNSHTSFDPAITTSVTFTVTSPTQVADLAALRADFITNGSGTIYELLSTPTVTYTRTFRNQKYIQDASAGILIDDAPGTIATSFSIGDGMSGLLGTASEFNGVLQFVPLQDATVTAGATVTPAVVTVATLLTDWENYESQLVRINNATFADAGGTFAQATDYDLSDGSIINFRTNFPDADYIGQTIPAGANPVVGLISEFGGNPQITSRSLTDVTLSTPSFETSRFSVYPNPTSTGFVNITSTNADVMSVAVFDVLGQQVINTTINNNRLDVSSLNTGLYVVKISQNNATITKKLIIE